MSEELPIHVEFPARDALVRQGYNVFSDDLEDEELIYFHATARENVERILRDGLRSGIELGGALHTISYARKSMEALNHWITIRNGREGAILAVKFNDHDQLFQQGGTIYSLALTTQPTVVAVCTISRSYQHV
jgi:hypothetical protein